MTVDENRSSVIRVAVPRGVPVSTMFSIALTIRDNTGLDDLMVDIVESQDDHEILAQKVSDFLYELSEI